MSQVEEGNVGAPAYPRSVELLERRGIVELSRSVGEDAVLHELGRYAADWLLQDGVTPGFVMKEQRVRPAAEGFGRAGKKAGPAEYIPIMSGWYFGQDRAVMNTDDALSPGAMRFSSMGHYLVNSEDGSFHGLMARGGVPLGGDVVITRGNKRNNYLNPNYRHWPGNQYDHFERLQTIRDSVVRLLGTYHSI